MLNDAGWWDTKWRETGIPVATLQDATLIPPAALGAIRCTERAWS